MNFESIKLYFNSLIFRWLSLKPIAKISFGTLLLLIPLTLILIMNTTSSGYTILYSPEQMKTLDLPKVKEILDSLKVSYKVNENNLILVPQGEDQRLRVDLALYGFPKPKQEKGYELFDSTTWIKGEKELQILELRALKGQLEKDLTQFQNIRSANVILEIPQNKSFSGNTPKAKASVILDLVPGARLAPNELRAITHHLASAVRGLTPNMVAISDTTGKLYQGLDHEESQDVIRNAEITTEEYIKAKVDGMLTNVVGLNNFYTTVQVLMNRNNIVEERKIYSGSVDGIPLGQSVVSSIKKSKDQQNKTLGDLLNSNLVPKSPVPEINDTEESEQLAVPVDHVKITSTPGKIQSLSIGILIDEAVLSSEIYAYDHQILAAKRDINELKKEIENQIIIILKGYDVPLNQSVDFVPFYRQPAMEVVAPPVIISTSNTNTILSAFIFILLSLIIFLLFRLIGQSLKTPKTNKSSSVPHQANLEEMLDDIRNKAERHPKTVVDTIKNWIKEDKIN